jgi:hypothetical protein
MAERVDFYQVFYKDGQEKTMFPFAIPYFNPELTPFFENSVIETLVSESDADKIGVCSWALKSKARLILRPLTESVLQEDFDVLSLSRNSKHHKMLISAEVWHPGFVSLLTKIMNRIGFKTPINPKYPIYQNAFIARSAIYKRYVSEFLSPAMEVMMTDEEIRGLCWQDSNYTKLKREPLTEDAKKYLGVSYYPMHPFLCERFFSQWLEKQNLNIQYL